MRNLPTLLLAALSLNSLPAFSQEQIIPMPARIKISAGKSIGLNQDSVIFVNFAKKGLLKQAKFIRSQLVKGTGLTLKLVNSSKAKSKPQANDIIISVNSALKRKGKEAYSITANSHGIKLSAATGQGLYYAFSSLSQMLPVAFHDPKADKDKVRWKIASKPFQIIDYPRFEWRAFMLDEARHFFGQKEVIRIIDQMALLKMNVLHWHLTNDAGWRIEIKKYPRLTSIGAKRKESELHTWNSGKSDGIPHEGFYTQKQIKQIVAYAAKRNVTIVPEMCMPGHFGAAATAYPQLSLKSPKEIPTTFIVNIALDPTKEKTFKFISDVLDEYIALFPGSVIHMGGDEVRYNEQWKGLPEIEAFMKKKNMKNLGEVQMYFSNRVSDMIKKKGRRAMGWNEIMGHDLNNDGGGATSGKLDRNAIVHFWKGGTALAKEAIKAGHDIVNSNNTFTYLDYSYGSISLRKAYNFEPIIEGLSAAEEKRIKGLGCQMWTEWAQTAERMNYQAFPRTLAYAEVGWTPKDKKDFNSFKKRLKKYAPRMDAMGVHYANNIATALSKSDFFNTAQLGAWTPEVFAKDYLELDSSKLMREAGDYIVSFMYEQGVDALVIKSVELLENGKVIAEDIHEGVSGTDKKNVQYTLNLDAFKQGAKYSIRMKLDNSKKFDSRGTIYFEAP